jgi:crotonobetainyl-CoA:carnitine CoA-transferase CaiB-like acyl-CoA transferase
LASETTDAAGHRIPYLANPIRMTASPIGTEAPPPLLGQHTGEVLADLLGYDEDRLAQLRDTGAI